MSSNVVKVDFSRIPPKVAHVARTWSTQQDTIFNWGRCGTGNLIVRARAGTGKTTTIVEMLSHMKERQILLAAFNKSIARELQARIAKPGVQALTLHGLGLKYIRRNWTNVRVEDRDVKESRALKLAQRACAMYAARFLSGCEVPDVIVRLVRDLHTKARELVPTTSDWRDLEDVAARFDLLPDAEWADEGWTSQAISRRSSSRCSRAPRRSRT